MKYTATRNRPTIVFDTDKETMEVYGEETKITEIQVREYGDGYLYEAGTLADVATDEEGNTKVISWKWTAT